MEKSVATASRNLIAIKRRKYSHYAYRGLQLLLERDNRKLQEVLVYPDIENASKLGELRNRLAWYLPPKTMNQDLNILVPTELPLGAGSAPPNQGEYSTDHLPLQRVQPNNIDECAREADALLTWDATARTNLTALKNFRKIEIVDPDYYAGFESYNWGALTSKLRVDVGAGAEYFGALEERFCNSDRSYVFATGPSLSRAQEMDFEDNSLKIVCNSIVKNDEMLAHIEPDVLVFADPVFHFGPSRYAQRFREDAATALRRHDCLAVIPQRHRSLFAGYYPEINVVGLSSKDTATPLFPQRDSLEVMSTNNIMTWFMLPIASAITDEINIIGADGREKGESYFWEHNEDAQYDDDLMKSAVDTHKSFFRDEIYSDYYEQHCETLSSFIQHGELQGKEYRTLTDSHVDCLAERTVNETKPMVN
jgi:hypothetical protein